MGPFASEAYTTRQWYHEKDFHTKNKWFSSKVKAGDVFYYLGEHDFPVFLIKLDPEDAKGWESCRRNLNNVVVWKYFEQLFNFRFLSMASRKNMEVLSIKLEI